MLVSNIFLDICNCKVFWHWRLQIFINFVVITNRLFFFFLCECSSYASKIMNKFIVFQLKWWIGALDAHDYDTVYLTNVLLDMWCLFLRWPWCSHTSYSPSFFASSFWLFLPIWLHYNRPNYTRMKFNVCRAPGSLHSLFLNSYETGKI